MNASTIATAIAALDDARLDLRRRIESGGVSVGKRYQSELDEIDAAIADLEALRAGTAAAPQPPYLYETGLTGVAMPRPDRIASLEIVMSGLDDYWAIQPEVQGHIANVREWLDELQRGPQLVTMPRPNWVDAQSWAMWWSVDAEGQSRWYEEEPSLGDIGWYNGGESVEAEWIDIPLGIDWRLLRERRPQQ